LRRDGTCLLVQIADEFHLRVPSKRVIEMHRSSSRNHEHMAHAHLGDEIDDVVGQFHESQRWAARRSDASAASSWASSAVLFCSTCCNWASMALCCRTAARARSVFASDPKLERTSANAIKRERAAQAIAWSRRARARPNSASAPLIDEGSNLRLGLGDL